MPHLEIVVEMATVKTRDKPSSLLLELISHTANIFVRILIQSFTLSRRQQQQQQQYQHISFSLLSP
jgi:hypothetical protein